MPQTADLVVIGAGIAGASTGFFAASLGLKTVVLDKGLPGSGATGRTAGYIRCHYANPHEAHFALESWKMHSNWGDIVGGDSGLRKVGHLFIVPPELVDPLKKNVALLSAMGVKNEVVDPRGLREIHPFMATEDVGAAGWEPESGYADPSDSLSSLLAGMKRRGGRTIMECGSITILAENGRVTGVRTDDDTFSARHVVIAAGAGTRELAAQVGVNVPVYPMPIGAGFLHRPDTVGPPMTVIDHALQMWYRGDLGDLLLTGAGYEDTIGWSGGELKIPDFFAPPTKEDLVASGMKLTRRMPDMDQATPGRTWVGVDSVTPDTHAIVGPVPEVEGLYVFAGGNGKLFKFGPPMGRELANVIAGDKFADNPLAPFRLDRFRTGEVTIKGEHEYAWGTFA